MNHHGSKDDVSLVPGPLSLPLACLRRFGFWLLMSLPAVSFLDVTGPTCPFSVHWHVLLRPLVLVLVLPCRSTDFAPGGSHSRYLSLVGSQRFCIYHWDRQALLSLFCALLQPWKNLCTLSKAPSLLKQFGAISSVFSKVLTEHFPKLLQDFFVLLICLTLFSQARVLRGAGCLLIAADSILNVVLSSLGLFSLLAFLPHPYPQLIIAFILGCKINILKQYLYTSSNYFSNVMGKRAITYHSNNKLYLRNLFLQEMCKKIEILLWSYCRLKKGVQ